MLAEMWSNEDHSIRVEVANETPSVAPIGVETVGSGSSIP